MRFETVFLYLYDVGRSVDLTAVRRVLSPQCQVSDRSIGRRADTPATLQLPQAVEIRLAQAEYENSPGPFLSVRLEAKIYEDGVVTIVARAEAETPLDQLHRLRFLELEVVGKWGTLDQLAEGQFEELSEKIAGCVRQQQYRLEGTVREDYHVYCLVDRVPDPEAFLLEHQGYLAPFLLGESPNVALHPRLVDDTMSNPFAFTVHDAAVFDLDRAFLIAPDRDYEDLVLIIEHANYQLVELRALDRLLDRLLDDVEGELQRRSLTPRLGYLQPLRLDALFLLENLENSSRIIGDYSLEKVYRHLGSMFNTGGWRQNVENRLDLLMDLYSVTKADKSEKTMVVLELLVVLMIGLELVALFLPFIGH